VIVAVFGVVHIGRWDLVSLLERAARPLLVASASLPAALAVVSVDSSLWVLGVHASAALATLKPFWETTLLENAQAFMRGDPVLPNIATQHFYLWFVWQGGSGATLPLALLLLRARSAQLKGIGRAAILPSFFNINEPIVFGVPIVLNPQLAIPFFAVPLLSVISAYTAFHFNWVRRPYLELPWTLPAPLGALASTGGDIRAVFLELFNLALGLLVYWPFVRRYDARLVRQEAAKAAVVTAAPAAAAG
jgi:PTS system cellobiose-specific IIC component